LFATDEPSACAAVALFEKMEEARRGRACSAGLQQRTFSNFFVPLPRKDFGATVISVSSSKTTWPAGTAISAILRSTLSDHAAELDAGASVLS
jgi:hypothetical protein